MKHLRENLKDNPVYDPSNDKLMGTSIKWLSVYYSVYEKDMYPTIIIK